MALDFEAEDQCSLPDATGVSIPRGGGGYSDDSLLEDREPATKRNTVETSPSQSLSDINQNACCAGEDTKDSSVFIRKSPTRDRTDWMDRLCGTYFFDDCRIHNVSKRERNYFCTSCCRPLCFTCIGDHEHGPSEIIQVRRYVYNDVLRVEDIKPFVNTSGIQNYTINGAKAVMLRKKLKSRTAKENAHACQYCKRSLLEEHRWCSLSCKLGDFRQGNDISVVSPVPHTSEQDYSEVEYGAGNLADPETESSTHEDLTEAINTDYLLPSPNKKKRTCASQNPVVPFTRSTLLKKARSKKQKTSSDTFLESTNTMKISIVIEQRIRHPRKGVPQRSPLF